MDASTQIGKKLTNADIAKVAKKLNEQERKRHSKPVRLKLSLVEVQVLLGIAQGRSAKELDGIIKYYGAERNLYDSYTSMVRRLMRKFEAFTIAHVVYKAMKMGIIE